MLGLNTGLIWSLEHRTHRYYRNFMIPKGKGFRQIAAPKIALKIIQKWIATQLERLYSPQEHVFGFVAGRSHIAAASKHCGARWVLSLDIKDFFPSTPQFVIQAVFTNLGYGRVGADVLSSLCCLHGVLPQGAPSSPVLSNLALAEVDSRLSELATRRNATVSRYADDIVLSGSDDYPEDLLEEVSQLFVDTPWQLSRQKTKLSKSPSRLKVHGLLVHGEKIRLTKGYRNKIRALRHSYAAGKIRAEDMSRIRGHIMYANQIERFRQS
jgi:hypothetical protein